MTIVNGYYALDSKTFLGPVTAQNTATGVAHTPRYCKNVCFGEYNTSTQEFKPTTNPYTIPGVMYTDEDTEAFINGTYKENVTGVYEDKGSDIKFKNSFMINKVVKPNRNSKHQMRVARTVQRIDKSELNKIDFSNLF